eukprot:TRINITY_DN17202_c0_g1_i1.p1 TRINITY_DN17202_c0_g1~~TRINITY_DN17202_c0_g1_i1.p1  ORF type:complete len:210 (+),score=38.80 TRINITY_DN17202_c0_g1_i1:71-700(+)
MPSKLYEVQLICISTHQESGQKLCLSIDESDTIVVPRTGTPFPDFSVVVKEGELCSSKECYLKVNQITTMKEKHHREVTKDFVTQEPPIIPPRLLKEIRTILCFLLKPSEYNLFFTNEGTASRYAICISQDGVLGDGMIVVFFHGGTLDYDTTQYSGMTYSNTNKPFFQRAKCSDMDPSVLPEEDSWAVYNRDDEVKGELERRFNFMFG